MNLKERTEKFTQTELELKNDLLKEIRTEFDKYNKNEVLFIPNSEGEDDSIDEFIDLSMSSSSPSIMDKYCQIDGTAHVSKITLEDDELRLYCEGESDYLDYEYISLEKPSWGLRVEDLDGILELLQNEKIKEINK